MTKKEYKEGKKLYGKKVGNWPEYKQKELCDYLHQKYSKSSERWARNAIIFASIGVGLQILGLILRLLTK